MHTDAWWTGKAPSECKGYNTKQVSLHSMPLPCLDKNLTKKELLDYFDNTWTLTEALFTCLKSEEGFYIKASHKLRHPLIFYYGHPAALYINKLQVAGVMNKGVNPHYEKLFETGVDEMSWDDMDVQAWPSVMEVKAYRKTVYETVVSLIKSMKEEDIRCINTSSKYWALVMSMEHERIHLETSSVLMNEMPISCFQYPREFPRYHPSLVSSSSRQDQSSSHPKSGTDYPDNSFIAIEKTTVRLGKDKSFPSYGWDNEYGDREFGVPGFKASKFKISNGEFFEFVENGGYSNHEYWSSTGWKWRSYKNAKWPQFWVLDGPQGMNKFKLRLLFDEAPMQWSWPVSINYYEAEVTLTPNP
jgi:5-histidylcysteine sulfoxide synthase